MKNILCFLVLIIFMGCKDGVDREIQTITPQQMQDSRFEEEVQLVDVRTPEEYKDSRLLGAQNICVTHDDFKQQVAMLDKNKPVYLYCKTGRRSLKAAEMLKEMGFKEIYNMPGGIEFWKEEGFDTEE